MESDHSHKHSVIPIFSILNFCYSHFNPAFYIFYHFPFNRSLRFFFSFSRFPSLALLCAALRSQAFDDEVRGVVSGQMATNRTSPSPPIVSPSYQEPKLLVACLGLGRQQLGVADATSPSGADVIWILILNQVLNLKWVLISGIGFRFDMQLWNCELVFHLISASLQWWGIGFRERKRFLVGKKKNMRELMVEF